MSQTDFKPEPRLVVTRAQWLMLAQLKAGPCRGCGGPAEDAHHLVSRAQRGDDVPANVVPLCRACHDAITRRLTGWEEIAAAVRASLTALERQYVVAKKGRWWLDKTYPHGEADLCPRCRRSKRAQEERLEPARPRKSWTVRVPADSEDGAAILDSLCEEARKLIGREEGTPRYFVLVESLAVFVRDAQQEAA